MPDFWGSIWIEIKAPAHGRWCLPERAGDYHRYNAILINIFNYLANWGRAGVLLGVTGSRPASRQTPAGAALVRFQRRVPQARFMPPAMPLPPCLPGRQYVSYDLLRSAVSGSAPNGSRGAKGSARRLRQQPGRIP